MKIFIALLLAVCSLSAIDAKAQDADERGNWFAAGRQVIDYLVDKHVNYDKIYDARDFELPAPDSLKLKTSEGCDGLYQRQCQIQWCPRHYNGRVDGRSGGYSFHL